ncbi:hypothetical protein C1645_760826 [Glomus cerebriforme]|uniref:Uncharacterized protein n=1 Tax=Glomus cerebriforme TaxID=658196 RepID=A0A397TB03_9GLOM|nr:hypothetical protein C1645_760826 [Glomus cerebriforme]
MNLSNNLRTRFEKYLLLLLLSIFINGNSLVFGVVIIETHTTDSGKPTSEDGTGYNYGTYEEGNNDNGNGGISTEGAITITVIVILVFIWILYCCYKRNKSLKNNSNQNNV